MSHYLKELINWNAGVLKAELTVVALADMVVTPKAQLLLLKRLLFIYLLAELDLPLLLLQDSMVEELVFLLVEVAAEQLMFV